MTRQMLRLGVLGCISLVITVWASLTLDRAGVSTFVVLPCAMAGFIVSFVLLEPRVVRKPAMVLALAGYSAAFAALLIWYEELGVDVRLVQLVGISGGMVLIVFFSRRVGGHWEWK